MKKNLFEMGANIDCGWSSDNKSEKTKEQTTSIAPQKHKLHFAREKRNGKVVTIAKPFKLGEDDAKALLKSLKTTIATGGTIKDDAMEFQGEVKEKLQTALIALGYGMK